MNTTLLQRALGLAWLLPPLFLLAMHARYALDFPMLDQWEFVPTLKAWHEGSLGFAGLFAQHNEHRPALPRVLLLLLAHVSGWDVRWESTLTLACAVVWYALTVARLNTHLRDAPQWFHALAMLALSALIFSAVQWQNWLLGWQLQLMLCVMLATATFAQLTGARLRRGEFALALLLACGASFSFANGLLVWPIGLLLLLVHPGAALRGRLLSSAIWIAMGGAIVTGYFWSYESPPHHVVSMEWGRDIGAYFFAYLGAPLYPYGPVGAALMGGMLLWGFILVFVAGATNAEPSPVALVAGKEPAPRLPSLALLINQGSGFWLALALYAVGSALLTTWARHGMGGAEQALSSRYTTISILLLVALLGEGLRQCQSGNAPRMRATLCLALLALVLPASAYGAYRWSEHANAYVTARPALLQLQDAPELHYLHPDTPLILERAAWLKSCRLALYP
jgi:hypothetical protein